jgi:FixJ family two-component response regulator
MQGAKDERVVVVVDDEKSIREAAESLLKSAGYRAECFASAEDLLSAGRVRACDCLVLDLVLPGMNGLQLQQRLRKIGVRVPIIFITATADIQGRQRKQALRSGAVAFLHKPFAGQELLDAVRTAIGI